MNAEKDMLEKASQLDFDPHRQAQQRVWARLHQARNPRRWIQPLAWGVCAALLVAAGGWMGMRWSAYLHCPAQLERTATSWETAQCKNANGKYVLSTQLECTEKNCSCTKKLTICSEHPVTHITRKACTNSTPDFNPQDPWNLWEKDSQEQIQNPASCWGQC